MPERAAVKLDIGASLPGEAIVVELLKLAQTNRETMSQSNRDEFDRIWLAQWKGWHNWWVAAGWPGEKV